MVTPAPDPRSNSSTAAPAVGVGSARFGFGRILGDGTAVGEQRALIASLDRPGVGRITAANLPDAAHAIDAMLKRREFAQERKVAQAAAGPDAPKMMRDPDLPKLERRVSLGIEAAAAIDAARVPGNALSERLALHWANHFTVGADSGKVSWIVGPHVREAIRPNLTGGFESLLRAAVLHPAMLLYLDNASSIGPNSIVGGRNSRGLNENLGREILELHTLGTDGGYTQEDVIALAKILTGWTVDLKLGSPTVGQSIFDPRRHEPGPKTLLGHTFPEDGPEQAAAAFHMLARHPSTARHVARRMTASFLSEDMPVPVVNAVAAAFSASGGDLKRATTAMIVHPAMWSTPARKVRPPIEMLQAAASVTGQVPRADFVREALLAMGQPFLQAPSPKGWSDEDAAWITSDGIKSRLDCAAELGGLYGATFDTPRIAGGKGGWTLSDETATALRQAESGDQALALFLMSPEVQRR